MIAIVLGTRPEIINMSPIIREREKSSIPYYLIHTGQYYSYDMDRVFFEELEFLGADYNLDGGSGSHAEQTGKIHLGVEKIHSTRPTDIVLFQVDINNVMAAALAAAGPTQDMNSLTKSLAILACSPTSDEIIADEHSIVTEENQIHSQCAEITLWGKEI